MCIASSVNLPIHVFINWFAIRQEKDHHGLVGSSQYRHYRRQSVQSTLSQVRFMLESLWLYSSECERFHCRDEIIFIFSVLLEGLGSSFLIVRLQSSLRGDSSYWSWFTPPSLTCIRTHAFTRFCHRFLIR